MDEPRFNNEQVRELCKDPIEGTLYPLVGLALDLRDARKLFRRLVIGSEFGHYSSDFMRAMQDVRVLAGQPIKWDDTPDGVAHREVW